MKLEQAIASVDFVARLADAWDGRGSHVFAASGREHCALLELANLPVALQSVRWGDLSPQQRFQLIFAARRAIEFGRACAWLFGEGQGARF